MKQREVSWGVAHEPASQARPSTRPSLHPTRTHVATPAVTYPSTVSDRRDSSTRENFLPRSLLLVRTFLERSTLASYEHWMTAPQPIGQNPARLGSRPSCPKFHTLGDDACSAAICNKHARSNHKWRHFLNLYYLGAPEGDRPCYRA